MKNVLDPLCQSSLPFELSSSLWLKMKKRTRSIVDALHLNPHHLLKMRHEVRCPTHRAVWRVMDIVEADSAKGGGKIMSAAVMLVESGFILEMFVDMPDAVNVVCNRLR